MGIYDGDNTQVNGGGWQKLLVILARDDVSELKINKFQNGVFIIQNGINTPIPSVSWGNEESFFSDFETVVFPYMHASGFEDDNGKPIRPHKLRYLYEGALSYAFTDQHGERKSVHARLHMVLKPTVETPAITIAKRSESLVDLDSFVSNGTMDATIKDFLERAVENKLTLVMCGPSGSGKTTLLRSLGRKFNPNERVLVAEDSPELSFDNVKDVVYMQSTPWRPGLPDNQVVTLAYIVTLINRMRGNRAIVGEVRSKEIHGFLQAAGSGLAGSMCTFHANNPMECLDRMAMLDSEAEPGRSEKTVMQAIGYAIDAIVQIKVDPGTGKHWISEIDEVSATVGTNNKLALATIFENKDGGRFLNKLSNMSDANLRKLGYR